MAADYRQGTVAGQPHWFCNRCGRDFFNEAAAQYHAATRHGATGTASGQTTGEHPPPPRRGRPRAVTATVAPSSLPQPEQPQAPRPTAPKGKWVAYAESLGIDTVDDDGKSLTKKQLIERTSHVHG